MSKYIRHQPIISRNSDQEFESDHWIKQFEKNLGKSAVQSKKVDQSLFQQINSIMNGKSKYPSVAAAVEEMKERSGFNILNKQSSEESFSEKTKIASNQNEKKSQYPKIIIEYPQILRTMENIIRDSRGNLSIPTIISRIQSIHKFDVKDSKDWDEDKFIILISQMNLKAKENNPQTNNYHNLGARDHDSSIDPSNTDAFHVLNPAKL